MTNGEAFELLTRQQQEEFFYGVGSGLFQLMRSSYSVGHKSPINTIKTYFEANEQSPLHAQFIHDFFRMSNNELYEKWNPPHMDAPGEAILAFIDSNGADAPGDFRRRSAT